MVFLCVCPVTIHIHQFLLLHILRVASGLENLEISGNLIGVRVSMKSSGMSGGNLVMGKRFIAHFMFGAIIVQALYCITIF